MTGNGQGRLHQSFRDKLSAASEVDPVLAIIADTFITTHQTLCAATHVLENEVRAIPKENPLAQRLMTIPGVGPMVSLSFITLVDDAAGSADPPILGLSLVLCPHETNPVKWTI